LTHNDSFPILLATKSEFLSINSITGPLTTKGFRDILEIQRKERATVYNLFYQKPKSLIPKDRIKEVRERMNANGKVIEGFDENQVRNAIHFYRILFLLRQSRHGYCGTERCLQACKTAQRGQN
jgi:hypothetical protein